VIIEYSIIDHKLSQLIRPVACRLQRWVHGERRPWASRGAS